MHFPTTNKHKKPSVCPFGKTSSWPPICLASSNLGRIPILQVGICHSTMVMVSKFGINATYRENTRRWSRSAVRHLCPPITYIPPYFRSPDLLSSCSLDSPQSYLLRNLVDCSVGIGPDISSMIRTHLLFTVRAVFDRLHRVHEQGTYKYMDHRIQGGPCISPYLTHQTKLLFLLPGLLKLTSVYMNCL